MRMVGRKQLKWLLLLMEGMLLLRLIRGLNRRGLVGRGGCARTADRGRRGGSGRLLSRLRIFGFRLHFTFKPAKRF